MLRLHCRDSSYDEVSEISVDVASRLAVVGNSSGNRRHVALHVNDTKTDSVG